MKNRQANFLAIAALAVVLISGLLYLALRNAPRHWSWYPGFRHDEEEPYGASVLYELLPGYCGGSVTLLTRPIEETDLREYRGSYLAMGRSISLTAAGMDTLAVWVSKGNVALLACETMPDSLPARLSGGSYLPEWWSAEESESLRLNFDRRPFAMQESHKLAFRVRDKDQPYTWTLMNRDSLQAVWPPAEGIGGASGLGDNLVRLPYGKGYFYLFSTPLALTNFFLVQPDGRDYAERVLSHLAPGDLLWDIGVRSVKSPHQAAESPLAFVLQQPGLRSAWYLLLLIGLLYLIFRTRRRQAAIPLLDPKTNQSLNYLNSVALLYYQQRTDHRAIGEMMREHFMGFLRERFHLRQPGLHDETAARLSGLSGQDPVAVRSLITRLRELDSGRECGDSDLLALHRELGRFYKKALDHE